MTTPATLIVIVPEAKIAAMFKQGYRSTDRANGFTVTMYKRCETNEEAHALGYKLPYIWAVEQAAP